MNDINTAAILNFESDNKTEALINEHRWNLPKHVQKYIKDNFASEEALNLKIFISNAWQIKKLRPSDERFKDAKKYLGKLQRLKRGVVSEFYNFSDEQLKTIISLGASRSAQDIVRHIFADENLDQGKTNWLAATVSQLLTAVGVDYLGEIPVLSRLEIKEGDYIPPQSDDATIKKINDSEPAVRWKKSDLNSWQKSCVKCLRENLNLLKFQLTIKQFKDPVERQLFETEFIRSTYNHPDYIADDVNSCMALAYEYVREIQLNKMLSLLDEQMTASLGGDERAIMTFAENHKNKTTELNRCRAEIAKIQGRLNEHYKKRQENDLKLRETPTALIQRLCDENNRQTLLRAEAAYNEKVLKPKLKEMEELDQDIGEIHGVSVEEILGFSHYVSD